MKIKFLEFKSLEEIAPVFGIEVFEDQFYFIGVDGREIQIGDKNWKISETLPVNDDQEPQDENRAKNEATLVIRDNKQSSLLVLQSGRGVGNDGGRLWNLKTRAVEKVDLSIFYNRLRQAGISNLNIESATLLNDKIVLCNRSVSAEQDGESRLIFTSPDFWKKQATAEIFKSKVEWEQLPGMSLQITALSYSYENDWLILTATTTRKPGEGDSDHLLDSYMGVVENAYRKSDRKRIKVNDSVNLTEVEPVFANQTIESFCIQADKKNKLKLHLVSNDNSGGNFLLKVRLKE